MKKRGKIIGGFVIVAILILFILKTESVISQSSSENDLIINQTVERNLKFKVMPAQTAKVGSGGGAKFPEQLKSEEILPKDVILEVKESQLEETIQENKLEEIKQQN